MVDRWLSRRRKTLVPTNSDRKIVSSRGYNSEFLLRGRGKDIKNGFSEQKGMLGASCR